MAVLLLFIFIDAQSLSNSWEFISVSYYVIELLANFFRVRFFAYDFEFVWFPKKCIKKEKLLSNAQKILTPSSSRHTNSSSNSIAKNDYNDKNFEFNEQQADDCVIEHELEHFSQRKVIIYATLLLTLLSVTSLLVARIATQPTVSCLC